MIAAPFGPVQNFTTSQAASRLALSFGEDQHDVAARRQAAVRRHHVGEGVGLQLELAADHLGDLVEVGGRGDVEAGLAGGEGRAHRGLVEVRHAAFGDEAAPASGSRTGLPAR